MKKKNKAITKKQEQNQEQYELQQQQQQREKTTYLLNLKNSKLHHPSLHRNELMIYIFNIHSPLQIIIFWMMSLMLQMILLILMMMLGWVSDNCI